MTMSADEMVSRMATEIERLSQQLADVTAERDELEHDIDAEKFRTFVALQECDRLREWKESAKIAMNATHTAWERCGKPGRLGQSIADAMADEVIRLRAELLHRDLQKEPDVDWLRTTFGEPIEKNGGVYLEWRPQMIVYDTKFNNTFRISEHSGYMPGRLETRAAVLAAVAEIGTK